MYVCVLMYACIYVCLYVYVCMYISMYVCMYVFMYISGPDGAVAKSTANGVVGIGFVSRYRLQPKAGF